METIVTLTQHQKSGRQIDPIHLPVTNTTRPTYHLSRIPKSLYVYYIHWPSLTFAPPPCAAGGRCMCLLPPPASPAHHQRLPERQRCLLPLHLPLLLCLKRPSHFFSVEGVGPQGVSGEEEGGRGTGRLPGIHHQPQTARCQQVGTGAGSGLAVVDCSGASGECKWGGAEMKMGVAVSMEVKVEIGSIGYWVV
jgi:hypothetical protein